MDQLRTTSATSSPDEIADVAIVGARCAGSAAAATFARAGAKVVVLDSARFPSDTVSSHTIFGAGIGELERIGALPAVLELAPALVRHAHAEMRHPGGPSTVYREHARDSEPTAISVRRIRLDAVLVDSARRAGADVREGCTVTGLRWRGGRVCGVTYVDGCGARRTLRSRLVLGADGQYSTVADLVGSAAPYRYSHTDRAAVYRYMDDPARNDADASTAYIWIDGTSQCFAFPTTPRGSIITMFIADRAEAHLARRDPDAYWRRKLEDHPGARARLRGATGATALRITDQLSSYFRRSSGPGWALIGDAGHFKDPAIGQGIRDAVWAGRTIAEAVVEVLDDPAALDRVLRQWEARRDSECVLPYLVGLYHARIAPGSRGVMDVVKVLDEMGLQLVPSLAARDGSARGLLTPGIAGRAVIRTLRGAERPISCLRDLCVEGALGARLLMATRRHRFRDDRIVVGFENPTGGWPEPPLRPAPPDVYVQPQVSRPALQELAG